MIGPVWVCEPVSSSHGVSVMAATKSPAVAVTALCRGRTGGGLLSVSVVGVPVAVITWRRSLAERAGARSFPGHLPGRAWLLSYRHIRIHHSRASRDGLLVRTGIVVSQSSLARR
jgi:hypothetical protein